MELHECVSFLLVDSGKVLLEKRSVSKETDPGAIAIPGGHIERGESRVQALIRELKEELDITPITHQYLCSLYHPTGELQLIHYYAINSWKGDIRVLEADEVAWHPIVSASVVLEADKVALSEYQRLHPHLISVNHEHYDRRINPLLSR